MGSCCITTGINQRKEEEEEEEELMEGGREGEKKGRGEEKKKTYGFLKKIINGLLVMRNVRMFPHSKVFQLQKHLQTVVTAQTSETVKSKT